MTDNYVSKYRIEEFNRGFIIWREDKSAKIVLDVTNNIQVLDRELRLVVRYDPSEYVNTSKVVSNILLEDYEPEFKKKKPTSPKQASFLRRKGLEMAAGAIARKVVPRIQSLIRDHLDPDYCTLVKSVRSVVGPKHLFLLPYSTYEACKSDIPFLLKDALKSRAAANYLFLALYYQELPLQNDWREVIAPNRTPYRAMNLVLDNYPGGMPIHYIKYFSAYKLERPITDRAELIATLAACRYFEAHPLGGDGAETRMLHTIQHTTRLELKKAALFLEREENARTGHYSNFRKSNSINALIQYVTDCTRDLDPPTNANFMWFLRQSIDWHREWRGGGLLNEYLYCTSKDEVLDETEVQKPPINPPVREEITFLGTYGALREESRTMHHCVSSYASKAAEGGCFLFHVEKNGEKATIEVSREGNVVQAYGPCNTVNKASKWGAVELSKWGAGFNILRNEALTYRPRGVPYDLY